LMEVASGGAQILLKNGDFLPVLDNFEDVEAQIEKAQKKVKGRRNPNNIMLS